MVSQTERVLRIMSYNVNDLPWPLKRNKKPLFDRMRDVLQGREAKSLAPDIVLLQDGFTSTTRDFVSRLDYPYVHYGNGALTAHRFE